MEYLHSLLKRHFAENQLRRRKMLAVSQVSRALLWSERVEVKKTNSNLTPARYWLAFENYGQFGCLQPLKRQQMNT